MVVFALCKTIKTLNDANTWAEETIEVLLSEFVMVWPKLYFTKDGMTVALKCTCTEEEFNIFIKKYNLTIAQIVNGIRFLKSS